MIRLQMTDPQLIRLVAASSLEQSEAYAERGMVQCAKACEAHSARLIQLVIDSEIDFIIHWAGQPCQD